MTDVAAGGRAPILFVRGQSAYGILAHFASDWGTALAEAGQPVHHLDLHAVGSDRALEEQLGSGRYRAVVGFSGAGIPTQPTDEPPIYERLRIPYLGMMLDHPVWVPGRHRVASPWVTYLFSDADHRANSVAMSPSGAPRLGFQFGMRRPMARILPITERRLPALYAKHGGNPDETRAIWLAADRPLQVACDAIADAVLTSGDLTAWEATAAYLMQVGRVFDPLDAVHLGIVQLVDVYVRRVRATRMLRALLPHQVVVVGGDWAHIDRIGSRASFVPGQELPALLALLDTTRVVVNVQPLNRHAPQERVIYGMQRGCVVATDASPKLMATLGAARVRSYVWDATLDEQIATILCGDASDQMCADAAVAHAGERFGLDACAAALVATIDQVVARCAGYTSQVVSPAADTRGAATEAPRSTLPGL